MKGARLAQAIMTRMPPAAEGSRGDQLSQADEVFKLFLDQLRARLARDEPSALLALVVDPDADT